MGEEGGGHSVAAIVPSLQLGWTPVFGKVSKKFSLPDTRSLCLYSFLNLQKTGSGRTRGRQSLGNLHATLLLHLG